MPADIKAVENGSPKRTKDIDITSIDKILSLSPNVAPSKNLIIIKIISGKIKLPIGPTFI